MKEEKMHLEVYLLLKQCCTIYIFNASLSADILYSNFQTRAEKLLDYISAITFKANYLH